MDWPFMPGTLRSDEGYDGHPAAHAAGAPRDAGALMRQTFRVWVSSKGNMTRGTPRAPGRAYLEQTPGASARTALDPGSD